MSKNNERQSERPTNQLRQRKKFGCLVDARSVCQAASFEECQLHNCHLRGGPGAGPVQTRGSSPCLSVDIHGCGLSSDALQQMVKKSS